jgi:hypothetical protein
MLLLITSIIFLISNLCLATIDNDPKNIFLPKEQCKLLGDTCQEDSDCCSDLICYPTKQNNFCSLPTLQGKRNSEELLIPPYYNPKNQLYPYGISKPALPFYKAQESKQAFERKKLEWDHCQFHEDCGEGNCCYVHFRFRSLPKWFCRPNRNEMNELCQPLTKYRSLKDVPAWKQQQQQEENKESQQQQR